MLDKALFGLTVHKTPAAWVEPTVSFGLIRTHDWGGKSAWRNVEQSTTSAGRGSYNWSDLDWLVNYSWNTGRDILFTLMSTPTWAARPAYQSVNDNYGHPGGGSPPNDMSWAGEFISALMSRYNAVSSFNPTGRRGIRFIEVWNEPTLYMESIKGSSPQWSDLATLTRVVNQAAKAIDPGVKIVSAGLVTSSFTDLARLFSASDGAGGVGGDWIDVAGMHYYGMQFSASDPSNTGFINLLSRTRAALTALGKPNLPIFNTEMGWQPVYYPTMKFHKYSRADQRRMLRQMLIASAAFGVIGNVVYDWDGSSASGGIWPLIESPEFAAGLSDAYSLVGQTMTYCATSTNGDLVVVANGATHRL